MPNITHFFHSKSKAPSTAAVATPSSTATTTNKIDSTAVKVTPDNIAQMHNENNDKKNNNSAAENNPSEWTCLCSTKNPSDHLQCSACSTTIQGVVSAAQMNYGQQQQQQQQFMSPSPNNAAAATIATSKKKRRKEPTTTITKMPSLLPQPTGKKQKKIRGDNMVSK